MWTGCARRCSRSMTCAPAWSSRLEDLKQFPAFLDPLEEGIKGLHQSMLDGRYAFGREDLPFMDLAAQFAEEIPFHTLLKQINETHRRGLEVDGEVLRRAMDQGIAYDLDLIRRYDQSGPRYTSYPTAVEFHTGFDEAAYRAACAAHQCKRSAPVAVLPHPLLRHGLLLLRLQQARHQGPHPGPALPGAGLPGAGDAAGAVRPRPHRRATALGRRDPDLHQPRPDGGADGGDPPPLHPGGRQRSGSSPSRSIRGRPTPTASPCCGAWASTA